jgi:hypothetical protein
MALNHNPVKGRDAFRVCVRGAGRIPGFSQRRPARSPLPREPRPAKPDYPDTSDPNRDAALQAAKDDCTRMVRPSGLSPRTSGDHFPRIAMQIVTMIPGRSKRIAGCPSLAPAKRRAHRSSRRANRARLAAEAEDFLPDLRPRLTPWNVS